MDKDRIVTVFNPTVKIEYLGNFKFKIQEVWAIENYDTPTSVLFDPVLNIPIAIIVNETLDIIKTNKNIFDRQGKIPISITEFDRSFEKGLVFFEYVLSLKYKNQLVLPVGFAKYKYISPDESEITYAYRITFKFVKFSSEDLVDLPNFESDDAGEDSIPVNVIDAESKEKVYTLEVPIHYNRYVLYKDIERLDIEKEYTDEAGFIVIDPEIPVMVLEIPYSYPKELHDTQLAKYIGLTIDAKVKDYVEREIEHMDDIEHPELVNIFTDLKYTFEDNIVETFKKLNEEINKEPKSKTSPLDELEELMEME